MPANARTNESSEARSDARPGAPGRPQAVIAERASGSLATLALLRWALVVIFVWFGCTPGVAEPGTGGFPAISAPIGQFLLKDLVLFAASLVLLHASVRLPTLRRAGGN